jgi:hypothetical protein
MVMIDSHLITENHDIIALDDMNFLFPKSQNVCVIVLRISSRTPFSFAQSSSQFRRNSAAYCSLYKAVCLALTSQMAHHVLSISQLSIRVISGFRFDVNEIFALLGCYAA